jgi:hypothetical protein
VGGQGFIRPVTTFSSRTKVFQPKDSTEKATHRSLYLCIVVVAATEADIICLFLNKCTYDEIAEGLKRVSSSRPSYIRGKRPGAECLMKILALARKLGRSWLGLCRDISRTISNSRHKNDPNAR